MSTQHLGNLLHRLEPGTHGSSTPIIQEFASPGGTYVAPEVLEIFLEQIGPDGFEVDSQQFLEFDNLLVCQVFRPFEQASTAAGKYRFFSSGLQLPRLRGSDLVDSFAKVGHNVEAIDDLHSLTGNLGNDSQIGFPHIAADKTESCGTFFAEFLEEPPQGFLGPFLSDPQEAFATGVDLIDQGQIFMSFLPGDFVNAEGQHVVILQRTLAIYKTSMQLYPIQYTFELHPVFSSLAMDFLVEFHNAKENNGMLYFQPPSGKNIFHSKHSLALTGTHKFC